MPKKKGTYGSKTFFVQFNLELREHVSFMAMAKSSQLVLLDFLFEHAKATNFDSTDMKKIKALLITPAGERPIRVRAIRYSFGMCNVDVSEATFRKAMKAIERHGFIKKHKTANGSYAIYTPSERWRDIDVGTLDEDMQKRVTAVLSRRNKHAASEQMEFEYGPQHIANKTHINSMGATPIKISGVPHVKIIGVD